jgi:hypothetical protein
MCPLPADLAEPGQISIGALSRATGIPVETLRTWEARYGFPIPERKRSGHRVYSGGIPGPAHCRPSRAVTAP